MFINTNIHHKTNEEEKKKVFLFCVENLKQLTTGVDSSWIIFENKDGYTLSIAKPDTGAESSFFGDRCHFMQIYKNRLEELTPDGLQLIGSRAK